MVRHSVNNVLELPVELLELIFGYLSYDEIAKIRVVCRDFNAASQRLLNRGFVRVEKYHSQCFKRVKSQLPRRESERRNHSLARHCDVLSAIETRLSLLGMTYMKYVDMNLCCFIPGKVIDEIYRVLRFIQNNPNPPRVHELLQELRDISSMAMEYFEEKIAPSLKSKLAAQTNVMSVVNANTPAITCRALPSTAGSTSMSYTNARATYDANDVKANDITLQAIKQTQHSQKTINKEITEMKAKMKDVPVLRRELNTMRNKVSNLEKNVNERDQTIAELKAQFEDLKRRVDEKDSHEQIKDVQHMSNASKRENGRSKAKANAKANNKQTIFEEQVMPHLSSHLNATFASVSDVSLVSICRPLTRSMRKNSGLSVDVLQEDGREVTRAQKRRNNAKVAVNKKRKH